MQIHHLYATCASSTTMVMRLPWYRVDANIGFWIENPGFGATKNKAEIPLHDHCARQAVQHTDRVLLPP